MKAARRGTLARLAMASATALLAACQVAGPPPDEPVDLVERGRQIFFEETFDGNGRTCGTCHRAEDNFAISPAFIATLPPDDPLFVAETNPALAENFENPALMREFGLILENQDGFDDLATNFNMRGVPHTLALPTSIDSPSGPRTGWSGDGAPGDGSLRSFATGAVIQHFPLSTYRVVGIDFRLPTEAELDALEAFQMSLGRGAELLLPLPLSGTVAGRGQEIFLDNNLGKCNICHNNAGANTVLGGQSAGNMSFNTGVEDLPDQPPDLTGELVPPDDGFGIGLDPTDPNFGAFNTPPLVEAADTGPFFHNNAIETIEGAVAFYDGDAFNNSPAGQFLANLPGAGGIGIKLDATQVVEVAAFLRVINALENIRVSIELMESRRDRDAGQAFFETGDAIQVLAGAGLHAAAVAHLKEAEAIIGRSSRSFGQARSARRAIRALERARGELMDTQSPQLTTTAEGAR